MTELHPISRKLYIWINQLLYLGTDPAPHREHAVVSDKLIICLQGNLKILLEDGNTLATKSCLVKAGSSFDKAHIDSNGSVIAIYYLAPLTQDYFSLKNTMSYARDCVHIGHPDEATLIETLLHIRKTSPSPEQVFSMLRGFIIQPHLEHHLFQEFDQRIIEVVQRIRSTVRKNLTVKNFADEVCLSPSRLEKLFKEQMGIPITKYRLRYRVFIGIIHLATGHSITDAALAAGFSSSSHFSKSFSAINGIPPSATFLKPPYLSILIADAVLNAQSKPPGSGITAAIKTHPQRIQLGEYDEYFQTSNA